MLSSIVSSKVKLQLVSRRFSVPVQVQVLVDCLFRMDGTPHVTISLLGSRLSAAGGYLYIQQSKYLSHWM